MSNQRPFDSTLPTVIEETPGSQHPHSYSEPYAASVHTPLSPPDVQPHRLRILPPIRLAPNRPRTLSEPHLFTHSAQAPRFTYTPNILPQPLQQTAFEQQAYSTYFSTSPQQSDPALSAQVGASSHLPFASSPIHRRPFRTRRKEPSCDVCKQRKVKCDATEGGSCTECRSRGIRCQFTQGQTRRTTSLSTRIQDLERELEDVRRENTYLRKLLQESQAIHRPQTSPRSMPPTSAPWPGPWSPAANIPHLPAYLDTRHTAPTISVPQIEPRPSPPAIPPPSWHLHRFDPG